MADTGSLQQFVDSVPDLVDHFRNDSPSPHLFNGPRRGGPAPIPPEWTNWREEQRAWHETAVLFDQSHHMPELFIRGPGASALLNRIGVNSFAGFGPGKAKQFVGCNYRGQMIGESVLYCHGEDDFELVSGMQLQNWVLYHAQTGNYDVRCDVDLATIDNATGRTKFRFGMDGPNAEKIFQRVVEGGAPDIPFFNHRRVRIAGCDVVALRHGMAGHKGVELSGRYEDGEKVRAELMKEGAAFGLKAGGTTAYFSACAEGGWMAYPVPAVFTGEDMRPYREWLPSSSWETKVQIGGSFVGQNIEDYYVTPWDMGYDRIIKFDHDFIGAAALQEQLQGSRRTAVSLVWNHEDIAKVFQSYFESEGLPCKFINLPLASYAFQQNDEVKTSAGQHAGIAAFSGYSVNEREMVSLAWIDRKHAELGTELVLTWGEPNGGSRKPHVERHRQQAVRVTVAPRPFSTVVQAMRAGSLQHK